MTRIRSAIALTRRRNGTLDRDRGKRRCAVQSTAAKMMQASVKWKANLYCDTLTRPEIPEATIHQPTTPSAAPRPNIAHSRRRKRWSIRLRRRNHRKGKRNAAPTIRARVRCAHSHQYMDLNSLRLIPGLRSRYCGIVLYFSNSACHALSSMGGKIPVTGFHSTMERPESVSLVAPPTTSVTKISAATVRSQSRTTEDEGRRRQRIRSSDGRSTKDR